MKASSSAAFIHAMQNGTIHSEDGQSAILFITKKSVTDQLDQLTIDKYYYSLKTFLCETQKLFNKSVQHLTEEEVLTLLSAFQTTMGDAKVWGEETRRGRWYIFRSFMEHIADHHTVDAKAYKAIAKYQYRVDTRRVIPKEAFTYEEQLQLIDCEPVLGNRAMLSVLFRGGLRYSEITTLRLCDVRIEENGIVCLNVHRSKTTPRPVYLVDWSAQFITKYIANHPLWYNIEAPLFLNPFGRPITKNWIGDYLKKLATKAGIHKPKVCAHIARHSAVTEDAPHMTETELDAKYGWSKLSRTSGHYKHTSPMITKEAEIKAFNARQQAKQNLVQLPEDRY